MRQINKTILTLLAILLFQACGVGIYILFCICVWNEGVFMFIKFITIIFMVINFILLVANLKIFWDKSKDGIKDRIFGADTGRGWQI